MTACAAGLSVAFLQESYFDVHFQSGRLVRVLEAWCEPFAAYHLYYPTRRQPTAAFTLGLPHCVRRMHDTGFSKDFLCNQNRRHGIRSARIERQMRDGFHQFSLGHPIVACNSQVRA